MNEQMEKYLAPWKEISDLGIKNAESFLNMQLQFTDEAAKAGIEQVKDAAQIKDAESMKTFLEVQAGISQKWNDRVLENTRNAVEMGNAYNSEVQRIVKDAFTVK